MPAADEFWSKPAIATVPVDDATLAPGAASAPDAAPEPAALKPAENAWEQFVDYFDQNLGCVGFWQGNEDIAKMHRDAINHAISDPLLHEDLLAMLKDYGAGMYTPDALETLTQLYDLTAEVPESVREIEAELRNLAW